MKKQAIDSRPCKIGAFEAKTHLADLLRRVEKGQSFEICRRGRPIARLVPPSTDEASPSPEAIRNAFHGIRRRISGPLNVRALIEAGRRH